MSGEADSGGDPAAPGTEPDDLEIDVQQEVDGTAPNTNYDSAEGAMPVLRCDRCDSFETVSRAALVSHTTQCAAAGSGQTGGDLEADGSATTDDRNRHHRKMFECDVCNMKFSNGANMRRHKMRHTGVKPYECRVCQKRFFRKDHLAEHFSTHTKTLPFHCPICSRGFQRQIAMRAHFQNEHVGQHDLVKACPLCTYRAPTMKALRVHFFNRHGIDLDNPGPGSSGILGLPLSTTVSGPGLNVSLGDNSDSGDSTGNRSTDNATPPMHFLTPHVEISMADTEFHTNCEPRSAISSALDLATNRINGDPPVSPQSADSNAPSSSLSLGGHPHSSHIMPSISLIPIKQEPGDDYGNRKTISEQESTTSCISEVPSGSSSVVSKNTSLIKVSPLKSLLREDLRRKLSARVSSRANRTHEALPSEMPPVPTTTNGTITSTGSDSDISGWRRLNNGLMCHFCGIGFPDQTLYFLHKGCHSESNPWKCNICGEQCNNVYEFNSHLLSKSHQ